MIQLPAYHTVQMVPNMAKSETLCFDEYPACHMGARLPGDHFIRHRDV